MSQSTERHPRTPKEATTDSENDTGTATGRGPVARIADVDALRGFALLGILLVNMGAMATTYHGGGLVDPAFDGPLHQAWRFMTAVVLETKFYLLFSFLFGYSFTLQMGSAERAGARITARILRRCAALLALGIAHALFLYPGDILITYSILGLILLTLRGIRPRTAVRTAITILAVCALGYLTLGWSAWAGHIDGDIGSAAEEARTRLAELSGDAGSVLGAFAGEQPAAALTIFLVQGPPAFAAFLLGLAAGKRGIIAHAADHTVLLRRLQWAGFTVGLAGAVFYAWTVTRGSGLEAVGFGLGVDLLTAPLLTAAYAATVLRVLTSERGTRLGRALAPAGRMALTNYLTQSLVVALIYTGYGLALVGEVAPALVTLIGLTLFATQLVFSRWWLSGHAYGPVEWVLRAATNARRPRWKSRTGDRATG
ncbi:DUF418 domain-containing protein [Streptomyces sp. NPDC000594]|uniref:DUF418 domain-containing protein n=1 Tax=Streptomyces sp. NPDC000594 TaxID=3154261 RepID=UPI0033262686